MSSYSGVITFRSSHHAVRAEQVAQAAGFDVRLVPGPKSISPDCGVALAVHHEKGEQILALLRRKGTPFEGLFSYQVQTKSGWLTRLLDRRQRQEGPQ